jgi:sulfate transport system ATP-binding protein
MEVASQVVVLNQGHIEQQGAPSEIYDHPSNAFVSKFIGQTNILHIDQHDVAWLKSTGVDVEKAKGIVAHIRPHNIDIEKAAETTASEIILKDWQHLGSTIRIELFNTLLNGGSNSLFAEMPNERFKQLNLNKGDRVAVSIKHAHWFN